MLRGRSARQQCRDETPDLTLRRHVLWRNRVLPRLSEDQLADLEAAFEVRATPAASAREDTRSCLHCDPGNRAKR